MDKSADGQRDFDAFVMSAKGETSTKTFQEWAGGERATLAILFTDVVGSTALEEEIRHVEEGDVFGGTVNFAARVVGAFKDAEI